MVLMALGPFRFQVPTFAYEELERTVDARWQGQPVIGRAPIQHFMGAGEQPVSLRSTFYPHFLNGRGLAQLADIERATRDGRILTMVSGSGRNFGRHVIKEVANRQTFLRANGEPQRVEVDLSLVAYDGQGGGGGIASLIRLFT